MNDFRRYCPLIRKLVVEANEPLLRLTLLHIGKNGISFSVKDCEKKPLHFRIELMSFDNHAPDILLINDDSDTIGIWTVKPDSELGMERSLRDAINYLLDFVKMKGRA